MKILHTSDWHLGITLNSHSMYDEQKNFIDEICRIAKEEKVQTVVIAGDIYDNSVSNTESIGLFGYAAERLCKELELNVITIAGNHDGAARLSVYSQLLEKSNMYIRGRISHNMPPIEIDGVCFYLMPYFNTDEAKAVFPDADIRTYTDAFNAVIAPMVKNMDKEKTNIAVTHSFITGAETGESDRSAIVGSAVNVSCSVFDSFDYVCAGHIHKMQDIGPVCRYCGTPMRMSFSEANQQKGVTIYDTLTNQRTFICINPLREMSVISGTFKDITENASPSDNYVKLELSGGYAGLEQQHMLKEMYPNLCMISVKNAVGDSEEISLKADDIDTISPEELIESYFDEATDIKPEKHQIETLLKALSETEEEV